MNANPGDNLFTADDPAWTRAVPWYLGITALVWRWSLVGFDLTGGFPYTTDYAHQLALFEWVHRALFEGAGPLLSPEFFVPHTGIVVTSETPFVLGTLFGLLRELSAGPILAWNLVFSAAVASASVAMYLAARKVRPMPPSKCSMSWE